MKRERKEPLKFRERDVTATVVRTRKPAAAQAHKAKAPKTTASSNSAIETNLYDIWMPPSVAMSTRDIAPHLQLLEDQLMVVGLEYDCWGYRMARATHGVHNGGYYWETMIVPSDRADQQGNVRVGWSTRLGELQAPAGYDKHSYGYRDLDGSKTHNGNRVNFGASFGPGDVVGCYLYLSMDDSRKNQMRFFKNGVDQGVAFSGSEITQGIYFPAVSIYKTAQVRINFGPSMIFRHNIYGANAVSEVQPMSPEDRKEHEIRIQGIREEIIAHHQKVASLPKVDPAAGESSQAMDVAKLPEK